MLIDWSKKSLANFATNEKQNQNQLHLVHTIFPGRWVSSQVTAWNSGGFIVLFVPIVIAWLAKLTWYQLVSGQSFQNLNSQLNCCRDIREIMSVT